MRYALLAALLCCATFTSASLASSAASALPSEETHVDSDHDGLSDLLENTLLVQFAPRWMTSDTDCSTKPAAFSPGLAAPTVLREDGTIYGQAFRPSHTLPATSATHTSPAEIELHYYHLWRQDCGEMSHALDAEHVAVLLRADPATASGWRAVYWYAAAHEDTVCDASQITRASTLHAESHGATIWVSAGKHAAFLSDELCHHGCGGDRCSDPVLLHSPGVENLGELSAPMNDAVWTKSARWPLATKMTRSDFPESRVARLTRLPESDVAWANPAKRPTQAVILGGNAAVGGVSTSGRNTDTALVLANTRTTGALGTAADHTGNALGKSFHNVQKALGGAAHSTAKALGAQDAKPAPKPDADAQPGAADASQAKPQ